MLFLNFSLYIFAHYVLVCVCLCIYLGFYVSFNTVQILSWRIVGRAEKTSTYSSSGFCTVNCQPMASHYQLSHLRPCRELNPGLRGGRRECYHSVTVAPWFVSDTIRYKLMQFGSTNNNNKYTSGEYQNK